MTATDKDGGASKPVTEPMAITALALQTDPSAPTKQALVVAGTSGDDIIEIEPVNANGTITVRINTVFQGNFTPTGHLIVYAGAGNDRVTFDTANVGGKTLYVTTPP